MKKIILNTLSLIILSVPMTSFAGKIAELDNLLNQNLQEVKETKEDYSQKMRKYKTTQDIFAVKAEANKYIPVNAEQIPAPSTMLFVERPTVKTGNAVNDQTERLAEELKEAQ